MPPDSAALESAIALLERGSALWKDIANAEQDIVTSKEDGTAEPEWRRIPSRQRRECIQQVFTQISGTVLDYYKRLHDFGEDNEASECTALELKPTSRAAAGGLRLAIQFLGVADSKDPRAFLSEGHSGFSWSLHYSLQRFVSSTLPVRCLVLDDVLTSIDKEHRRRVGELLYSEFQELPRSSSRRMTNTGTTFWLSTAHSPGQSKAIGGTLKLEGWSVDDGAGCIGGRDRRGISSTGHLTEDGLPQPGRAIPPGDRGLS